MAQILRRRWEDCLNLLVKSRGMRYSLGKFPEAAIELVAPRPGELALRAVCCPFWSMPPSRELYTQFRVAFQGRIV